MTFEWESEKERLLRFMRIPPRKKLEWLYQINEFINKYSSKQSRAIRRKLRENRG